MGVHQHDAHEYVLALFEESRGTQALFVLLRHILPVLTRGGVAYINEFELGLHSHMIPRILDLFYSSKHNDRGAQIIFSTHADYVIQRMEKSQMLLVEKNDEGVSEVYGLDDIKGVRADENHYSKYHAGAYGGVPRISSLIMPAKILSAIWRFVSKRVASHLLRWTGLRLSGAAVTLRNVKS